MELHAIWNRIDQLEQLIILQAKEIDMLRRIVNATQISLQNSVIGQNQSGPVKQNVTATSDHSATMANHHHSSLILNGDTTATKTTTNQPLCKAYIMNPFVHPASAIPPVANRVLVRSESNQMRLLVNNSNATNSGLIVPLSRTLPANTRWSTGPSLFETIPDNNDRLDVEELPRKRRNRLSLVELLTCFCPCFSMC